MNTSQCPFCGVRFTQADGRGRARKYCSSHCRTSAGQGMQNAARETWPECSVAGCAVKVRSSGAELCEMHYGRVRRYGATDPMPRVCKTCEGPLPSDRSAYCSRMCGVDYNKYLARGFDPPSLGRAFELNRNGVCDICHQRSSSRLHMDHSHSDGEVRGMLCTRCNSGLGMFRDDPKVLQNAIEYLALGLVDDLV